MLSHVSDIAHFKSGDVVIGTLAIHLAAALYENHVAYMHFSIPVPVVLRGKALTHEQLVSCSPQLLLGNVYPQ